MKCRRPRGRSGTRGFTLLETLIAVALMAAVLVALATVTAQWLPNWNRGFGRAQRTELFSLGLERLIADLSAAEFVAPSHDVRTPLFSGTEQQVTFVRTAVGPGSRPGLEIVRVAETSDLRGPALVRMRAPFAPLSSGARLDDQVRLADPVVLVRAPYRLSFAYAGPDRVWRNRWVEAAMLPSAVRLRIRDSDSEEVLAVSTVALVRAQVPVDCVLNTAGREIDCGAPRPLQVNNDRNQAVRRPASAASPGPGNGLGATR